MLTIPVDNQRDPDVLLMELSSRFKESLGYSLSLLSELEQLRKENELLKMMLPLTKEDVMERISRKRIFFIDEVRLWLKKYDNEEISFSKFVEIFNDKAYEPIKLLEAENEKLKKPLTK